MLSIIRQTDNSIKIKFDENGEPLDITGYTILFTLKKECDINKDDDYALITKEITEHSDPEAGITYLVLDNDDTDIEAGEYFWDLRLIKDDAITQTQRDTLTIIEGVTKRNLD